MSSITDTKSLPLSSSVQSAIRHFASNELIHTWAIVSEILKLHPEYARQLGGKMHGVNVQPKGETKTLLEWLNGLSELFDIDKVKLHVGVINGRLAIWGLSRLDPQLKSYLDSYEFLMALEQEYMDEKQIHPSELVRQSPSAQQSVPSSQDAQPEAISRLTLARAISDDLGRVDAIIQLLPSLQGSIRSEAAMEAYYATKEIGNPSSRVGAIIQLLPSLQGTNMRSEAALEAYNATKEIGNPSTRGEILDALSRYLPQEKLLETFSSADTQASRVVEREINTLPPANQSISFSPPVAGYVTDRSDQESPDLLSIEHEVANIANVLTFKQVQPPLALGLFGDWGSGKTFFMGKLHRHVGQIASHYQKEEEQTGADAMWCSRVAQIEFNAWHFSDSNLWASLVTRIYEGLDRELNREKETADDIKKKIIEAQIKEAKEKSVKAESQLDLAKTRVSLADGNLKTKRHEREDKENELKSLISNLPNLLKAKEFDKPLREATSALGMPEAAETYEALELLDGQIRNFSGRLKAVTASFVFSPSTIWWMVLFVFAIPILLTFAIELWAERLSEIGKRVAETSTFLLFIIGWLQTQVRRGLEMVKRVQSALSEARKVRQEKIENDVNVSMARTALTEAQTEEQAAQANLEVAKNELQRLQGELQELRPERKLQRLIEARTHSGAYAQHLGIVSLIRSDFEMMSNILSDMANDRERDFKKAPPIQRIILYIDDLDRCKPERVVEILEAIHLLLFFPLFVVVVAVDPRWLRHSLAQHYPATLNENGGRIMLDGSAVMSLFSTPQDYLEKIFQIPFALRPVEKAGYQSLVEDLLKPLPSRIKEATKEIGETNEMSRETTTPEAGRVSETLQRPDDINTDKSRQQPVQSGPSNVEQAKENETDIFKPIPPRQLEFTKWEQEDIQQLWLMFRTPRTVKRFINIYRLLRAGLVSDMDVKIFEGTQKKPGEYQTALLLLAAITAFPNESNRLLYRLDAWLDIQELNKKRRTSTWKEVIGFLKTKSEFTEKKESSTPKKKNQNIKTNEQLSKQTIDNDLSTSQTEAVQSPEDSWHFMLDCLDRITQISIWKKPFKLTTLRTWVLRVARFSFSVQPT